MKAWLPYKSAGRSSAQPPFSCSAHCNNSFFDGDKRTSRFMMNGVLMSHGIDAISVPAAKAQAFNEKMVRFYLSKDATEMMAFLAGCHPEAEAILPQPENT